MARNDHRSDYAPDRPSKSDPTPEEIAECCRVIQMRWTRSEECYRRTGLRGIDQTGYELPWIRRSDVVIE